MQDRIRAIEVQTGFTARAGDLLLVYPDGRLRHIAQDEGQKPESAAAAQWKDPAKREALRAAFAARKAGPPTPRKIAPTSKRLKPMKTQMWVDRRLAVREVLEKQPGQSAIPKTIQEALKGNPDFRNHDTLYIAIKQMTQLGQVKAIRDGKTRRFVSVALIPSAKVEKPARATS